MYNVPVKEGRKQRKKEVQTLPLQRNQSTWQHRFRAHAHTFSALRLSRMRVSTPCFQYRVVRSSCALLDEHALA